MTCNKHYSKEGAETFTTLCDRLRTDYYSSIHTVFSIYTKSLNDHQLLLSRSCY